MLTVDERVDALRAQRQPVQIDDPIAEAGRKVLLVELVDILRHEEASRTGRSSDAVHDMRVAIRRSRSTLRLLSDFYKQKTIRPFLASLRKIARALGNVRDLDVLIENLLTYRSSQSVDVQLALDPVMSRLHEERVLALDNLNRTLNKPSYSRFIDEYMAFLTTPGDGALPLESEEVAPSQVRHVLPTLVYQHLGQVRAYDSIIETADDETLHALRIEFKRLRYAVTLFSELLGSSIKDFISELKTIQDHLGRMNDIVTAHDRLEGLIAAFADVPTTQDALRGYVETLDQEHVGLRSHVTEVWRRFNSRTVQRQLANAVAVL